jgi:hypothetical protein
VTVFDDDDGGPDGAVKSPVVVIVPTVADPPAVPFTDHVTAVFDVFEAVALNDCVFPYCTEALAGETATVTAGGGGADSVTVAWPNDVELAADVALMVTVAGFGSAAGAV